MSTQRELLRHAITIIEGLENSYDYMEFVNICEAELAKPETNQLIVKDVIKQKWKEGFDHGTKNIQSMYQEIEKTKNSYMDENEKLTNYILELENKIEELANPEQEPVGQLGGCGAVNWFNKHPKRGTYLYTSPPQYEPLSDEEILKLFDDHYYGMVSTDSAAFKLARAIEKRINEGKK